MTSAQGCAAAVLGAVVSVLALAPAALAPAALAPAGAAYSAVAPASGRPDAAVPLPAADGATAGGTRLAGSLNWAGYAVSRHGVTFRSVSATFFVPYLNCAESPGATLSSAWAGLDGFTSSSESVEQTGIAANCSVSGSASYFAWFEMYPYAETRIPMTIRPGDSVTAAVSWNAARKVFRLTLSDTTRGEHYSRAHGCPDVSVSGTRVRCLRSSAEIIAEAPSTGTSQHLVIAPLSDYGAISFARIAITDGGGTSGGILSRHWNTTKIIQLSSQSGPVIARPTPVAYDVFSDYWLRES
jgi:hypothetical protein